MPTLPEIVAGCVAQPAPILFVDTCALLDIIRYVERINSQVHSVQMAQHLLGQSQQTPVGLHMVIHELVPIEWQRHQERTVNDAGAEIIKAAELANRLNAVAGLVAPTYRNAVFSQADGLLVTERLKLLSERMLMAGTVIEGDMQCEHRAYTRCRAQHAPASKNKPELADCTIIEHYLEVCAQLPATCQPRVFLSSNTQDYGVEGSSGRLREPLLSDFASVGLQWARSFSEAARLLHMLL